MFNKYGRKINLGLSYLNRKWWYLRGIVWDRFNVVKCQTLPPTWNDRDQILLHVAFQCLVDFIDKEYPWAFDATNEEICKAYSIYSIDTVHLDDDDKAMLGNEFHSGINKVIEDWALIRELYNWWNVRKHDYGERTEDDEMLHKLIDIRGYMWT